MKKVWAVSKTALGVAVVASLAGCASLMATPSSTTQVAYAVYGVTGFVNGGRVVNAVIESNKHFLVNATIRDNPPPGVLPVTPGRYIIAGTSEDLAADVETVGIEASSDTAACPGAQVEEKGTDRIFNGGGRLITYTVCLYPYQGGYQADAVAIYNKHTGTLKDDLEGAFMKSTSVTPITRIKKFLHTFKVGLLASGGHVARIKYYVPPQKL